MLMPEPDPVFVRASVARKCNLDCVYCPKPEGMENRVPNEIAGQVLDRNAYMKCLAHISDQGVRGISFTGGEPTLNSDLPWLVQNARRIFDRVELTTNGLNFRQMLPQLSDGIDVVKISLDTLRPTSFSNVTRGDNRALYNAQYAVEAAACENLTVGINAVIMRSNFASLFEIIDFACDVNARYKTNAVYVSLLDFHFSPSRKETWEREFLPADVMEDELTRRYGAGELHERFGCRFTWYDANGVLVRLKDSFGATQRAIKCLKCPHYCQEGIYGLKLSAEGWVTTCPTNDPNSGVRLTGDMTKEVAREALAPLIDDLNGTSPDPNSFNRMLEVHDLRPTAMSDCSE